MRTRNNNGIMEVRKSVRVDGKVTNIWSPVMQNIQKPVDSSYNEHSIRILSQAELEQRSAFSITEVLVQEYPATAPEHLERVSECLISFGWEAQDYRDYRNGVMQEHDLKAMQEWFSERNKQERSKQWLQQERLNVALEV